MIRTPAWARRMRYHAPPPDIDRDLERVIDGVAVVLVVAIIVVRLIAWVVVG